MSRLVLFVLVVSVSAVPAHAAAPARETRQWPGVHPYWRNAFVLSFRSPDLLSNDPDEQWGQADDRLTTGGILTDFPAWLAEQADAIRDARAAGRPILLSLHLHGGWGTGLVTYRDDLRRAQVANYPWLVRQLLAAGLDGPDVTVTVDTCNAEAAAAYQLRPDLFPRGVDAWFAFARWRRAEPARLKLPVSVAYQLFEEDRVRVHLVAGSRGSRTNVKAAPLVALTPEERRRFRAHLYGPHGVVVATPAFFNVLRLGPEPRHTNTADLLHDRLDGRVIDGELTRNRAEFHRFRDFAFLAAAGAWQPRSDAKPQAAASTRGTAPAVAKRVNGDTSRD